MGKPDDFLCKNVGYDYNKHNSEIRTKINEILNSIFDSNEVVEYLLKKLAVALDGSIQTEELDIMQGSGRNGKGLLDQLIRLTFGSYYSTIDISYFTTMTKKSNEASPEMADKNGVRLLMSTKPESEETIKVKTIKKVTGGDIINARKLYQNDFSFNGVRLLMNYHKQTLILSILKISSLHNVQMVCQQRLEVHHIHVLNP
jgi:phage/plasmid-associated DNA primase